MHYNKKTFFILYIYKKKGSGEYCNTKAIFVDVGKDFERNLRKKEIILKHFSYLWIILQFLIYVDTFK